MEQIAVLFKPFILVLLRMLAILMVVPVFGRHNIPPQVVISIALILSIIITPMVKHSQALPKMASILFALIALKEILIGIIF